MDHYEGEKDTAPQPERNGAVSNVRRSNFVTVVELFVGLSDAEVQMPEGNERNSPFLLCYVLLMPCRARAKGFEKEGPTGFS